MEGEEEGENGRMNGRRRRNKGGQKMVVALLETPTDLRLGCGGPTKGASLDWVSPGGGGGDAPGGKPDGNDGWASGVLLLQLGSRGRTGTL